MAGAAALTSTSAVSSIALRYSGSHCCEQPILRTKKAGSASMVNVCTRDGVAFPAGDFIVRPSVSLTQPSGGTGATVSNTASRGDGGYCLRSQSVVGRSATGSFEAAVTRVAWTLRSNCSSAAGSSVFSLASCSGEKDGAVHGCGSRVADSDAATSAVRTGWLDVSRTTIRPLTVPPRRYQRVSCSPPVGVVKRKVTGFASLRPLTAVADVLTVTS